MRPEGWKNPWQHDEEYCRQPHYSAYEAGADAMLDGLEKNGHYIDRDDSFTSLESGWTISIQGQGSLVFVPEGKE